MYMINNKGIEIFYFWYAIFTFLFFSSCLCSCTQVNPHISPPYVEMAGKIRSEVAHKLAKRYKMEIFGIGGGMADCVNMLGLDFQIQGPLPKEQLRIILIDSVKELLSAVNSDKEIRPFLKNYPFTEQQIIITLFVVDKRGENVYDPEIAVASAGQGTMYYNPDDKANKYVYKHKIREDYETALKIVNEENKK